MWIPKQYHEATWELAEAIGCNVSDIRSVLHAFPSTLYTQHWKPKKGGGGRIIRIPQPPLYGIQKAIAYHVLSRVEPSPIAHAYISGRSIFTNCLPHLNARSMYAVDLKDAFSQISFSRYVDQCVLNNRATATHIFGLSPEAMEVVRALIEYLQGYEKAPSDCYLRLLFPRYPEFWFPVIPRLPQGAPSSPAAFNIALWYLDWRLSNFAARYDLTVTRYSDNIFLSSLEPEIPEALQSALRLQVRKAGVALNLKKSRYIRDGNREGVPLRLAGLSVINGEVRLPVRTIDQMRMRRYCAQRAGDESVVRGIDAWSIAVYGTVHPRLQTN